MSQLNTACWLPTSLAAQAIDVHPITLKRRRDDGYLKHGVHFRKTGESRNSQYIWNIEKCLEVFDLWKAPNKKIKGGKVMSDLIKSIPDGWKNEKGSVRKPSRLSPGQLVDLLEQALGQDLKWNCLTLEPEFESKLLGENIQNYFHIFLNQKGWTIGKVEAQDALIFAAKKNCYNPVWEWLERIENDSDIYQVNINTIATDFLGTHDPLYDKMLKALLIGTVSRAAERGCKFENRQGKVFSCYCGCIWKTNLNVQRRHQEGGCSYFHRPFLHARKTKEVKVLRLIMQPLFLMKVQANLIL